MARRGRAFARAGAACAAAAVAIAGCSSAGSSSSSSGSSSVTATGHTLAIYLSEPADVRSDQVALDIVDAEQLAFDQDASEVKAYKLVTHTVSGAELSDNARAAIQDASAIAYIGELAPGGSEQTVGITNAVDLPQVSPTDTALELGATSPVVSDSPKKYFESWSTYGRTFVRMAPTSGEEAVFLVKQMLGMGLHSVYVASDGSDYGHTIAYYVKLYAAHAGLSLASSESSAGAIFYGTQSPATGLKFFTAAARAAPSAKLFGPSSLDSTAFLSGLSSGVARRLYFSTPGIAPGQLTAAGRAFERAFRQRYGHQPTGEAIFGYAAMSTVLSAIAKAGANGDERGIVAQDLLSLHDQPSVLGTFSIDSSGNTSIDDFVLNRAGS